MKSTLYLNTGVRHRIFSGHPWVFKSEVARVTGEPKDGDTVEVRNAKGKLFGSGIYNSRSQIIFRRYSHGAEELNAALLEKKIDAALAWREKLNVLSGKRASAQRLIWSESDHLPGVIVDRYGDVLVIQLLTMAMARLESELVRILVAKLKPATVISRNDAPVRKLEGLPLEKNVLHGQYTAPTEVQVAGLTFALDLWSGQKTGFYLDQADNYAKVAHYAKGRNILDCFTNQGAFALAARAAGAASCRAIDQSDEAIQRGRDTAKRHSLDIEWIVGNVFDLLPAYERERHTYDMVILDPPSFTKTKGQVDSALRGYKELHLRALRLLPPGGLLASFCCSHHVGEAEWQELLSDIAGELNISLRLVERMTQSRDHPVLTEVPETEYLRGYLLEKLAT
jgi:23S rRNA (cytosine1962-C5)-methyltransferase